MGNATWTLTGGDAGSIATTAGATSFVNIQTLTGGAGNDSFVLNGGTLSGAINGGLGVNTLTADNLANTWVINAADGGTVTGITGGFTNIGNLIGGTNTDSFTLSGGTLSGAIDGGLTGVNTLTADNVANTWTISGADTGTVTGIGGTFSHIANLTGGSNDDAFTVGASGSVSGLIDGGAQVGSDTLDYSAVTAAVTTKIGTNFTNIESVTGDGINDTLVGADVANTWTVNGANAGTVGTVAFNGFSNLTGGTNTDGFTLSGGTLSGALNGGTGTNTLTGDNVANTWIITGADAGYGHRHQRRLQQHRQSHRRHRHRQLHPQWRHPEWRNRRRPHRCEYADRGQRGQHLEHQRCGHRHGDGRDRRLHEHR